MNNRETTIDACLKRLVELDTEKRELQSQRRALEQRIQDAYRKRVNRAMTSIQGTIWIGVSFFPSSMTMRVIWGKITKYTQEGSFPYKSVRIYLDDYYSVQASPHYFKLSRKHTDWVQKSLDVISTTLPTSQEIVQVWVHGVIEDNGTVSLCKVPQTEDDLAFSQKLLAMARLFFATDEQPGKSWINYICTDVLQRPDLCLSDLVVKHVQELPNADD